MTKMRDADGNATAPLFHRGSLHTMSSTSFLISRTSHYGLRMGKIARLPCDGALTLAYACPTMSAPHAWCISIRPASSSCEKGVTGKSRDCYLIGKGSTPQVLGEQYPAENLPAYLEEPYHGPSRTIFNS